MNCSPPASSARRSNQSILKEISPGCSLVELMWSWNSSTLATWCKELTHLKRSWCWERLRAGEGDDRGCDGEMASPTQWTWVWVNSGSWWWTGRPDVLGFMGSQGVRHDWATELNWASSAHGIFQARILKWVAISFSRGSSWPRDWIRVSCISYISRQILYHCDTWEAQKQSQMMN